MAKEDYSKLLAVDFSDWNSLIEIMDKYNHLDSCIFGTNSLGETTCMSVSANRIKLSTFQDNDVTRVNVYNRDRTSEEWYER